jgi:putative FmdB family regulatory protein
MPIYEYACTACGERTEARQGFDDPPLELCPHCGGKLRKLYSPVGIVFKGSGFYSTDQKSSKSGKEPASKGKDGSKPSSESKSEKKTETKSESSSKPATEGKSSTEKSA